MCILLNLSIWFQYMQMLPNVLHFILLPCILVLIPYGQMSNARVIYSRVFGRFRLCPCAVSLRRRSERSRRRGRGWNWKENNAEPLLKSFSPHSAHKHTPVTPVTPFHLQKHTDSCVQPTQAHKNTHVNMSLCPSLIYCM